jgi:hypothetical protein
MKIYKNAWFERFARKQRIADQTLWDAIDRAEHGLVDADLGGGVIKQRVAREGQGKSGGFRTIVLYRTSHRAFFVYGFAKNALANIDATEIAMFKQAAHHVLGLSEAQLAKLIVNSQFMEVIEHDEKVSK